MEDAETRRTLIFNTLANLPPDVLATLLHTLLFYDRRVAQATGVKELIEVLDELMGAVPEKDRHHHIRNPVSVWTTMQPQENRRVYGVAHGLTYDDVKMGGRLNMGLNVVLNWFRALSLKEKRAALERAGITEDD